MSGPEASGDQHSERFRSMFFFKKKIHRDRASETFIEHCRAEAVKLNEAILPQVRAYCDGGGGRPSFSAIVSRPVITYEAGRFESAPKMLLDAHCYAIATAAGLDAIGDNIDPADQADVMLWRANKLIVEEDVGKGNTGHAPSPRPAPGVHVSYVPGTFVGGVPSQQQQLTNRYRSLATVPERLTLFLLSLRVFRPGHGLNRVIYDETNLGHGIVGRNRVGIVQPDPDQIDEWEEDLEIADAGAALSELPEGMVRALVSALKSIDPFWPKYCKRHRLTW